MGAEKSIVLTTFGQGESVERISVSSFDVESDSGGIKNNSARNYCRTINTLELKNGAWISARIVEEHAQYAFKNLLPASLNFAEAIIRLDDRAVMKFLRAVADQDLVLALKGVDSEVHDKIFRNLSIRAAKLLKEDMEFMNPIPVSKIEEEREKLATIILRLETEGDIAFNNPDDEVLKD
ncbi:hypothetical protein FACS189491_07860 [Spirochaetia bacterium]|nr:hypothetical protein FACS189491_07860 [Spirochaetia bacterium]